MTLPSLPARRLLLTAGPRAGKTRLLRHWSATYPSQALCLSLTPEDRDPEFFAYRLLRRHPEAAARFGADRAHAPWGQRLAAALAHLPDLGLFLDDAHTIEDSPLSACLAELPQRLAPSSTLVLASRHRLPFLEPALEAVWGADHPGWEERPVCSDLAGWPSRLLAKAVSLALVGEAPPSSEGLELVRRNVAGQEAGRHVLRAPWREAVSAFPLHELPPSAWEVVEQDLRTFWERSRWTHRGEEMLALIARLPASVRAVRPSLLEIEGQACFDACDYEAAHASFEHALALPPVEPEDRQHLALQRLEARFRLEGPPAPEDLACLPGALVAPSTRLRARALLNQGRLLALQGEHAAAARCWEDAARSGAEPDRTLAMVGVRAESNLHAWATLRDDLTAARRHRRRIRALADRWSFERSLPQAFLVRCREENLDESRPPRCELHWDPALPFPAAMRAYFLEYLGQRARYLGEYGLALRCFDHQERLAATHALSYEVHLARLGRMLVHAQAGELERARAEHAALAFSSVPMAFLGAVQLYWVRCLLELGEGEAAARELPAEPPPYVRVRWEFLRRWIDHQQGRAGLEEIRSLVDSPEGRILRRIEARALHGLGLVTLPPIFKLHVFGSFDIVRLGAPAPVWPRRRSQALLAMLALQPDDHDTADLPERLFWDWLPSDPRASLHGASSAARKALRAIGGEHLLESSRWHHRLVAEAFAFNELSEFETFFQQGMRQEEAGDRELAAFWYAIALHYVSGEPCENLPELEPPLRQSLRDRIQRARLGAGLSSRA